MRFKIAIYLVCDEDGKEPPPPARLGARICAILKRLGATCDGEEHWNYGGAVEDVHTALSVRGISPEFVVVLP